MRKFRIWLAIRVLSTFSREGLIAEIHRLEAEVAALKAQIRALDAYIDGLEAGIRAQRRIVINTCKEAVK